MSSTGITTSRSIGLRWPASTIVTGAVAAQEAGDLLQRPLRRRQPDPLRLGRGDRRSRSSDSARWAPRLVPATAWISSTITVSTEPQDLAGARGQHQVQRLGRGDQDVRRVAADRGALATAACRRCAGRRVTSPGRRRCRRAARAGCARRRGSARCSGETYSTRVRPRSAVGARAGRAPTGMRPASCPSRSAPGSACGRREAIGRPALRLGGRRLGEGAAEPSGDAIGER